MGSSPRLPLDLLPDPRPAAATAAPRPRRTLMHLHDAGAYGYSLWGCPACERTLQVWMVSDDWPVTYQEPCPWCGPTWGRLAVARPRVEVLADHSTVPLEVPDGE